jgi:MFS family permease
MNRISSVNSGWVVVGISFITLALSYAIWYSFSVFFVALLREFGWSRSIGAGAFSLFIMMHHLFGPFVGRMVDRLGPRRIVLIGSSLMGAGLALCSFIQSWWQFYISFGLITALGIGATGWVTNTTIVHSWFRVKRGLPIGIISSGIGVGILVCVPSIQYLIDGVGWRMAYRIMAVFIPGVVGLLALLFLKRPPQPAANWIPPEAPIPIIQDRISPSSHRPSHDWTLQQAMATRSFWLLSLSFFLGSFASQSIFAHHVAFFVDRGLEALFASYIVGLIGISSIGAKILMGTLSDRIGREWTYTLGTIFGVLAMVSLIAFKFLSYSVLCYLYAVFFATGYAATAALPPVITSDFFGGKTYGQIFGTIFIGSGLGGACGAWVAGLVYDLAKGYLLVFFLAIVFFLLPCWFIWWAAPRSISRRL